MNWIVFLYNSLLVVVALDAIASILAAAYMYTMRQRFGYYLALAFTGVAVEASVAVATMGFSSRPTYVVGWIIAVRILARLIKMVTMVLLPLFLLGYINGDKPEVMNDSK